MCLTLRFVAPSDEAFLFELYASTRKEELDAWGWDMDQRKSFLEQQFRAQRQSYRIQFPQANDRIIMKGARAVGRMMVLRGQNEFRLIDISLLPEFQNAGIGTRLLRDLLEEASEADKPLRLQVLKTSPAVGLYTSLHFAIVGHDDLYLHMEVQAAPDEAG